MDITYIHRNGQDLIGLIPNFIFEQDSRPAAAQFNDRYSFGGGWRPMNGWETARADDTGFLIIKYPGDPAYRPVAMIEFRDETIWVYQHAWVAIEQADGSVEIARMD